MGTNSTDVFKLTSCFNQRFYTCISHFCNMSVTTERNRNISLGCVREESINCIACHLFMKFQANFVKKVILDSDLTKTIIDCTVY